MFRHLDSAKSAGYCAVVDTRARTCQLVSPKGPIKPEPEPDPAKVAETPEPEPDDEDEPAPEDAPDAAQE
jgi:hypothetical protein